MPINIKLKFNELLKNQIYSRLRKDVPFVLTGQRGIGKSLLLEWSFSNYSGAHNKAFINCMESYNSNTRKIAKALNIDFTTRTSLAVIEKEIIKRQPFCVFVDNIDRAAPKYIHLFNSLNTVCPLYFAGNEPFKEALNPLMWGKKKIRIGAIAHKYRQSLARMCVQKTGTLTPVEEIISLSRGIPGRFWAISRGEPVREESDRVAGEEVNIAPIVLIGFVSLIVITRYSGMALGQADLYFLGGVGMALAFAARLLISEGTKKGSVAKNCF